MERMQQKAAFIIYIVKKILDSLSLFDASGLWTADTCFLGTHCFSFQRLFCYPAMGPTLPCVREGKVNAKQNEGI